MLTAIKGIYKNGQIILEEYPNLPVETQVVVTFLEQFEKTKPKKRIIGSMEGLFMVPDDFNEPLLLQSSKFVRNSH
jgi:hypothetical protein